MTEMNATEATEKRSLNFIEQAVENDLKERLKTGGKSPKPVSRLSPTVISTSVMPRPFAWILG